jgi:hemerythrin-like domain-containing protein
MNFVRQVNHALDQEHRATLDLLGRVEQAFLRMPPAAASRNTDFARLAASLAVHIEQDIGRHFEFEERELFPRLEASGDGELVSLLMEEHVAIREVAGEVLPLAQGAATGTLESAGWAALKRGALEMAERLTSHIDKETSALMPLVDDVLDEETDRELALHYAMA